MTSFDPHDSGDPLLVRPFLHPGEPVHTDPAPGTRWPSSEYRTIKSHREPPAAAPEKAAPQEAPRKRKRALVLAGAGAATLIGLSAAGYVMFRPVPTSQNVAIPAGTLPPVAATTSPAGRSAAETEAAAPPQATSPEPRATTTTATTAPTSPAARPTESKAAPEASAPEAGAPMLAPPAELARPPAAARVGPISGAGGLCLDLNGGVAVDDNHIQVFTCNDSPAQQWTLATDGTLRVQDKCAQVVGDGTVHIVGCDARTEAQWRVGDDGSLVSAATGGCLTGGTSESTRARVAPCRDDAAQEWDLPN